MTLFQQEKFFGSKTSQDFCNDELKNTKSKIKFVIELATNVSGYNVFKNGCQDEPVLSGYLFSKSIINILKFLSYKGVEIKCPIIPPYLMR